MRGTKLRKQLATVTQIAQLNEGELEQVANFMGHDLKVHREFYRLPTNTIQMAKVSKLLLALDEGKIKSIKGCSLDDISLDFAEELSNDIEDVDYDDEMVVDDEDENNKEEEREEHSYKVNRRGKVNRIACVLF